MARAAATGPAGPDAPALGATEPAGTGSRTPAELLELASRFSIDRNDRAPGEHGHDRWLVLHVERERPGRWWIRRGTRDGEIYNLATSQFDDDWTAVHTLGDDRDVYLLDRDAAVELALAMPLDVLTGDNVSWRWPHRG